MEETVTRTRDDLTGDILLESKRVSMLLDIDGDQKEFTLDFEPKVLAALIAAFEDHDYAPLRQIFRPEPQPAITAKPRPKPKASGPKASAGQATATAKEVNAWLKANGRGDEVTRGQPSKDIRAEYLEAQRG